MDLMSLSTSRSWRLAACADAEASLKRRHSQRSRRSPSKPRPGPADTADNDGAGDGDGVGDEENGETGFAGGEGHEPGDPDVGLLCVVRNDVQDAVVLAPDDAESGPNGEAASCDRLQEPEGAVLLGHFQDAFSAP